MTEGTVENNQQGQLFLKKLTRASAREAGILLPVIRLDDGRPVGCRDIHFLSIASMGKSASVKISHAELNDIFKSGGLERASEMVQHAVTRLCTQLKGS